MGHTVVSGAQSLGAQARPGWRAVVLTSVAAVAHRWQEIGRDGAYTPFQAREWIEGWYKAAAKRGGISPVIVAVDAPDGRSAMVLPLALATAGRRSVLAFADGGGADYNAPLLGPGAPKTPAEMRQAWQEIKAVLPRADVIRFEKMPADVEGRPNPLCWLPGTGLSVMTQAACAISQPYEAARARLMTARFRARLDASLARLRKKADIRFGPAETEAEIAALFDELMRQKDARARVLGWESWLDDPVWRAFYREVALKGASGGAARTLALWVNGDPAAIILGFQKGERFCDIVASFDAGAWKSHSLGLLVQDLAMAWMAERGVTIYDMTIGAEGYKDDFGPVFAPLYEYVAPGSLRGMADAAAARAKSALRLSPALTRLAKRLLRR